MNESNIENHSNDLIKIQNNFNNLQKLFVKEKEKNLNLENELKERDKVWIFFEYFDNNFRKSKNLILTMKRKWKK